MGRGSNSSPTQLQTTRSSRKAKRVELPSLRRLDALVKPYGIVPFDHEPLLAPPGIALGATQDWRRFEQNVDSVYELYDLAQEFEAAGYKSWGGGKEQSLFTHEDHPDLVFKTPSIEKGVYAGVPSMFTSLTASRYKQTGEESFLARGAISTLYWHQSGIPIITQEKLTDLQGWHIAIDEEKAASVDGLVKAYHQYGYSERQQTHAIYDYDACSPFYIDDEKLGDLAYKAIYDYSAEAIEQALREKGN